MMFAFKVNNDVILLISDDIIANLEQIQYIDLALLNHFAPGYKRIWNADTVQNFATVRQIAKIKSKIF